MNPGSKISKYMSELGKKSWDKKTDEQKRAFAQQAKKASEAAKERRLHNKIAQTIKDRHPGLTCHQLTDVMDLEWESTKKEILAT